MKQIILITTGIFACIIIFATIIFLFINKNFENENLKHLSENIPDFKKSLNVELGKFVESPTTLENTNLSTTSEEFKIEDAIKYTKRQEEIESRINQLVIGTEKKVTIAETCDMTDKEEKSNCKKDLFIGCANSLYLGFEMTTECREFSSEDYDTYLSAKRSKENNQTSEKLVLKDIGEVYVTENPYTSLNNNDFSSTINSSEFNNNFEIQNNQTLLEERMLLEPILENMSQKISYNKNARSYFSGWVSGWGTLFAINGGKKEAGQVMNKYTAFGYNPYVDSACIVSLPYKTVDKFFNTTLDKCVKQKNIDCIQKIKNLVKDRGIEVIMLKNGKRAVLPLGDFGPAEWTGNAIDFTKCSAKVLGATGKDLVKFRPL